MDSFTFSSGGILYHLYTTRTSISYIKQKTLVPTHGPSWPWTTLGFFPIRGPPDPNRFWRPETGPLHESRQVMYSN